MRPRRVMLSAVALGAALGGPFGACQAPPSQSGARARGAGLPAAPLRPPELAAAYDAALHQAFDIGPELTLLLDPALLPRAGGYDAATPVSEPVARALTTMPAFRGVCVPEHERAKNAPRCAVERAGYAIRISEAFRMPGDSLRLYLTAERYRARDDTDRYVAPFAFEERYTLVRERGGWVVVRKERVMIT